MWSKISSTFRKGDGETSNAQQVALIGQVNYRTSSDEPTVHPRDVIAEEVSPEQPEGAGVLSPPGSPGKKRNLLKRASKVLSEKDKKESTLSLAKRVKSSLHLNTNINSSDMSLTSPTTNGEFGNQQVFGSVRSLFSKDRRPSAMQMQAAMNTSEEGFIKRSSEDTRPSTPSPLPPILPLDAHQRYGSVRSILRDRNTPASGQNVRFFSRDAYRVISPDVSGNAGSSVEPEPTTFMQRVQDMGADHSTMSGNDEDDTATYHSAYASPHPTSPHTGSPNPLLLNSPPDASSTPYVTPQGSSRNFLSPPQMPIPPPQLTGGFDHSSKEHIVHPIPEDEENIFQDNPGGTDDVEQTVHQKLPVFSSTLRPKVSVQIENRVSSHSTASTMSLETPNSIRSGTSATDSSLHRLSDEVVFHSATEDEKEKASLPPRSSSALGLYKKFKRESVQSAIEPRHPTEFPVAGTTNRSRSLSERVFFRPPMEDKNAKDSANTSTQSDPTSNKVKKEEVPDPFRADASNYYNSAAGFPNSPPRISHVRADSGVSGISSRSARSGSGLSHRSTRSHSSFSPLHASQTRPANDSDEMVIALRTQLAFHQELATQYERDLRAKDAQATLMTQKLQAHEAEAERRSRAMRGMRRRVAELERAAAALEEQAERTALENFERSVLDGASGDALKGLHQQIADLEKERAELGRREKQLLAENEKLKEGSQRQKGKAKDLTADGTNMNEQQASAAEVERHREIELAWAEDRARLVAELDGLQHQIRAKDNELNVLKEEVEAQWGNTEKLTGQAEVLQKAKEKLMKEFELEREQLRSEIAALEARTNEMEIEWTESENRKLELERELTEFWEGRQNGDRQLRELQEDIRREQAEKNELHLLVANLQNEMRILKEERQFDLDNTLRQEHIAQERQAEAGGYAQKLFAKERELEAIRDELSALRREHARVQTEQTRALGDSEVRANDARGQLNDAIRARAIAEVEAKQTRERISSLEGEVETLRSRVQVMNQRSADQDVKVLQLERQHDQDVEDKIGLNIALDSKQQELDLLKRNLGVRVAGGATPAAPVRTSRRESALFKTPIPIRSSSALSDASNTGKASFGKSSRVNGVTPATASTVKNPRLSENAMVTAPLRPRASIGSVARKAPVRVNGPPASLTKRVASGTDSARRSSFIMGESGAAGSLSEASSSMVSDKENATPRPRASSGTTLVVKPVAVASRRNSMQPLSIPA